jgi:hypothetical protein
VAATWDKAGFERYYRISGEPWGRPSTRPPIYLHYNYGWIGVGQKKWCDVIAKTLGGVKDKRIALIGCGFNWTGEGFVELGATVVGTEVSSYILQAQNETEEADLREYISRAGLDPDRDKIIGPSGKADLDPLDHWIRGSRAAPEPRTAIPAVDEDGSTVASRNKIAQRAGGGFDEIITEEVLNSVEDAVALNLCDKIAALAADKGGRVIHILSPLQPEKFERGSQQPDLNWKLYDDWRKFLDDNGFADHWILPSVPVQGRGHRTELF